MNDLEKRLTELCGGSVREADDEAVFAALIRLVNERTGEKTAPVSGRKLYYISAEFLIGRMLSNNLINLGIYGEVGRILRRAGKSLSDLAEREKEPSLGNGGLGRLAACFLDSLAMMNLPGDGIGLLYHCGLFRQKFEGAVQKEEPDDWIGENRWAERTETVYPVSLAGRTYQARLWQMPVAGADGRTNRLNLFDLDTADEGIITEGIAFPKDNIEKNLTLFLYPDDSDEAGRLLRLYQQYFMVSAAAQLILSECEARGGDLRELDRYAAIQINDTHPSMVIPELIRLLGEKEIGFDEAAEIVTRSCAYTNHTVLAEALETWPMEYLERVVPQLVPIIGRLDALAKARTQDEEMAIIDREKRVHMAHMDIHFTNSVNGVADLHTEILKNCELKGFHALYPGKFSNKTNGISFRRWLFSCNPKLTERIEQRIGKGFYKDASELEGLTALIDNPAELKAFAKIKAENKKALCRWLYEKQGAQINPKAMFSIQAKRLHEYKRQQLNLLFLIHQYFEIKAGRKLPVPLVSIFGAKAAPAYTTAKDIIHALQAFSRVIENDPRVSAQLQLVFVENYNVTAAEKMIPACDLSEQISLAGKEASGTGNMKFMLNGALTIGTLDGANVEIARLVGRENMYLFGQTASQVMRRYEAGDYCAREWYENDDNIRRAVDFLISEEMMRFGCRENLERLRNELIGKDWFQTLPDFNAYVVRKQQAMADYALDSVGWQKKCIINIAKAGYFSSDRTIAEYNRDIWRLGE